MPSYRLSALKPACNLDPDKNVRMTGRPCGQRRRRDDSRIRRYFELGGEAKVFPEYFKP
jgi:hypothetical protein